MSDKPQKPLKCLLIKKLKNKALSIEEITTSENHLKDFYNYLDCSNIDIQERFINGICYDFIFDGEFLINGKSQSADNITAITFHENKPIEIIFGNLIICRPPLNNSGEETDIKKADFINISQAKKLFRDNNGYLNEFIDYKVFDND